jgi:hypothetical protein
VLWILFGHVCSNKLRKAIPWEDRQLTPARHLVPLKLQNRVNERIHSVVRKAELPGTVSSALGVSTGAVSVLISGAVSVAATGASAAAGSAGEDQLSSSPSSSG